MAKSRVAVALLALALSSATPPAAVLAADICQDLSFRMAPGTPVLPNGTVPMALSAGTYIAKPGAQPGAGCGCDLAIGLQSGPSGALALFHGNDDGSFSRDTLRPLDGIPVAIATGRFRMDAAVEVIVVVTWPPSGNGKVQVFVPDASGVYPQTPTATFPVGAKPAAITTGDFDGDGLLDVAVISQDNSPNNSSLTILLGDGTGSFAPNVFTVANLGATPTSLTAGKFSGTSAADDIAIAVEQSAGGAKQVGILIVPGSTTKQFVAKPVIAVGARGSAEPFIDAANLSGPLEGAAGRRKRDLAIAFTDRDGSGNAVGRVKVLLGRDGGGFGDIGTAQTLDIGAHLPGSIKVVDLDGDGTVDLVVSAFGKLAGTNDGTVHFFQGRAAPAADVGFQSHPNWFTISADTAIRPRALVAAKFGNHRPDKAIASMGLAAINVPNPNSILVFLNNGQGAFTEPSVITTTLGDADQLFVPGDFHSADGSSPLKDMAFVTKVDGRNVLRVLQANGAGGFAPPDSSQPPLLAGTSPVLIAAGQFVANGPNGVAIIDHNDAAGGQPLLKVFLGTGNGDLNAGTNELALPGIGAPRAMVTGHFRGPDMPLDIALVSSISRFAGKLTLLLNNGQGAFSLGTPMPLGVGLWAGPDTLVASSRLRPGGKTDLLVRDATTNRFQFLVNITTAADREPVFRPASGQPQGFFGGAGNFPALLVSNVAHVGSDALDDVVTFDNDMSLKIFVNNGLESFDLRTIPRGSEQYFAGAQPPYLLADFGSGTLGLAAAVKNGGEVSLLLLRGDGNGGFTPATEHIQPQRPLGTASPIAKTEFSQPLPGHSSGSIGEDIHVRQSFVAQFRSAWHGNGKPDFAMMTQASAASRISGKCAGDNTPLPPPRPMVCPTPGNFICHSPGTCEPKCCFCTDESIPPQARCPTACNVPLAPPVPFQAFCNTQTRYTPTLTVFANTCGD